MRKKEIDSLEFVCENLNRFLEGDFYLKSEEEDYGIDLGYSGYTEAGSFYDIPYEVKTMRGKFNDREYLTKKAGRNSKCRYAESAETVEELEGFTECPDFGNVPIMMINSTDRYGRPNGKWHKLEEAAGGLVFLKKGEILVFTQKALQKAFLGFIWIKCTPTTDFGYEPPHWERKAAIDIDKWSMRLKCEVPRKFWEEKNDKCRNS